MRADVAVGTGDDDGGVGGDGVGRLGDSHDGGGESIWFVIRLF